MKKPVSCLAALLALTCASCGKGLYPVSGKVTYQGQPAAGAAVFFHRSGGDPVNEPMIMGLVADDGTFTLVCGGQGRGAPPGDYHVLIEWRQDAHRTGRRQQSPDRLWGRYADLQRPLLHATVKAETNNLPPFELTD